MSSFTNKELNNLIGFEQKKSKSATHDYDGIYIFLSFDIVNSTAYKSLNPSWTTTFSLFREFASREMRGYFRGSQDKSELDKNFCDLKFYIWKNLGDEIIFMFPNPKVSELYKLPNICWQVLNNICSSLEAPTKTSSVKVSVKATIWLAEVNAKDNINPEDIEEIQDYLKERKSENKTLINVETPFWVRNINIAIPDENHRSIDFLGPDIDSGFRLSHYASHNKLTIDARLCWILLKLIDEEQFNNYFLNTTKIVAYKPLKGVWNEKPYPIIWYIPEWENKNLFFYYEEVDKNSLAAEIISKKYQFTDINKLETVLSDSKQLSYSIYILQKLREIDGRPIKKLESLLESDKLIELHLICLCLNEKDEILILQRAANKKYRPLEWEFGCTYLNEDSTIEDSLINGYHLKIGTKIDVLNNYLPIRTIKIDRNDNKIINALVFVGRVKSDKIDLKQDKYINYRWIPYNTFYPNKKLDEKSRKLVVSGFEDRFNDVYKFLAEKKL